MAHLSPEKFETYRPRRKYLVLNYAGDQFKNWAKDNVKAAKYLTRAYNFILCERSLDGEYAHEFKQEQPGGWFKRQIDPQTTLREKAHSTLVGFFNDINKNDNYTTGCFYYYLAKLSMNHDGKCLGDVFFPADVMEDNPHSNQLKGKSQAFSLLWNYSFKRLKLAAFVDKDPRALRKLSKLGLMDTFANHVRLQFVIECEKMKLENSPEKRNYKTLIRAYKRQMALINVKT